MMTFSETLHGYQNQWVAVVGNRVVASGQTLRGAKQKAEQAGVTDSALYLVPSAAELLAPGCS